MQAIQYRAKLLNGVWGDWGWLPRELIFCNPYPATHLQFRVATVPSDPLFIVNDD